MNNNFGLERFYENEVFLKPRDPSKGGFYVAKKKLTEAGAQVELK